MTQVLFSAGSVLRGDDAVGPMLAKRLTDKPDEAWVVIDGGQTPEDDLATIRRLHPDRIVLVDAADMGEEPGSIKRLTAHDVATSFLITTHSLPITFLLGELEQMCDDVCFLGVQIKGTEFFDPLSPAVAHAVDVLDSWVREGGNTSYFPRLSEN